jgi:hypothetical protein
MPEQPDWSWWQEEDTAKVYDYLRDQLSAINKLPYKKRAGYIAHQVRCSNSKCQDVVIQVIDLRLPTDQPVRVMRYRTTELDSLPVGIDPGQRALKLCSSTQLGVVSQFIADAEDEIARAEDSLYPLDQNWLDTLGVDRRNIIQLSEPQLAVGDSADQVLDFVFANQLVDPTKTTRNFIDKNRLLSRIRDHVRQAIPDDRVLVEHPFLTVGGHITTQLDMVFGLDRAVQITQAWSFQRGTVDDVAKEVKAWGYVLERLRNGEKTSLTGNRQLPLADKVPIGVLIAEPTTPQQQDVFDEATEVFQSLDATVYGQDDAARLVSNVSQLLGEA